MKRSVITWEQSSRQVPSNRTGVGVAQIAVGVVVLAAMYVFVLPQIASYTAVWRVIQQLS